MRQLNSRISYALSTVFFVVALCLLVSVQGCKKPADGGGGSTTSVPIEGVTVIREIIGVVVTSRDAANFSGLYKNTPYSSLLVKISGPSGSAASDVAPIATALKADTLVGSEGRVIKYYLVKDDLLIRDKNSVPNPLDEVTVEADKFVATTSETDPRPFTIKFVTHVISPEPASERIIVQATVYDDLPDNSPLGGINYAICEIPPSLEGISADFAIKSLDVTDPDTRSIGVTYREGTSVFRNFLATPGRYDLYVPELVVYATGPEGFFSVVFKRDGSHRCTADYNDGRAYRRATNGVWTGVIPEF